MKRQGTVILENGRYFVEYDAHEACKGCGACGGDRRLLLLNEFPEGARVEVEIPDNRILPATALAFVLPLAGMLVGLFFGYNISGMLRSTNKELWGGLCGAGCAALAYFLLRLSDKRLSVAFQAKVVSVDERLSRGDF